MPFNEKNLAGWLGSAGSSSATTASAHQRLSAQLFEHEIGGDTRALWIERLEQSLDRGIGIDELRMTLLSSMDRFSRNVPILGAQTERYRHLLAFAHASSIDVAPQILGECIASYQLILGRDPDDAGFLTFVSRRATEQLPTVVASLLASAEATARNAPHPTPPVELAVLMVTATGLSIVNSAGTDAAVGLALQLRQESESIGRRLGGIERQLDALSEYIRLRLDATVLT